MSSLKQFYRGCLVRWHKPRHWQLRPRTIDRRVFLEVAVHNDYRLPRRFNPDDVIIDVGGHIGVFAFAALQRGAGMVYCCEADARNYQILRNNLEPYQERVVPVRAAIWRSDMVTPTLYFADSTDGRNTAAGQMTSQVTDQEVPAVAFDELLRQATRDGERRIRLLKLDCEGAEWPILLTSKLLSHVDAICGEYHLQKLPAAFEVPGYPTFTPQVLQTFLQQQGFHVEVPPPHGSSTGLFFATQTANLERLRQHGLRPGRETIRDTRRAATIGQSPV